MADKEWVVSHARARAPITVSGKTLNEALEKEGLDPAIWKEVEPTLLEEPEPPGEHQGNQGPD